MAEILIKLGSRILDPADEWYLREWTTGDILGIYPDGFYAAAPDRKMYEGMMIVRVGVAVPQSYHVYSPTKIILVDGQETKVLDYRSEYWIDVTNLGLSTAKLKELFDHSIKHPLVNYTGNLLNIVKHRDLRTGLSEYDKGGSVTSGSYTVGSGSRNYASISAAEADCANLTGDLTFTVMDADNDTTGVSVNGFATNSYTLKFTVDSAVRHQGVFSTSKYRITKTGTSIGTSRACWFDGFQVYSDPAANGTEQYQTQWFEAGTWKLSNSIFAVSSAGATYDGRNIRISYNNTYKVWNCIAYGFSKDTFCRGIDVSSGTIDIYNCTVTKSYYGILRSGGTATAKNCAVFNNSNDFDGTITIDYCASDDGDGTNAEDFTAEATDWAAVFTDYANNDYSLKNYTTSPCCVGQGVDDPGSGLYSDDIKGTARSSTWDIGAFEYVAAGGATIPVFMRTYQNMRT